MKGTGKAPVVERWAMRELHFEALGSACHLFGLGVMDRELREAEMWVRSCQEQLTRFEPASELCRLNAAAGDWTAVSPLLEDLLREALAAHERSGGLVHAGVLTCLVASGYGRTFRAGPTAVEPERLAPPPSLPEMLQVEKGRARLSSGTGIDLGGLAKGWLADCLAQRLGENVLVNLGGDLFARGAGTTGEGWPVEVGGSTLLLADRGAATSSTKRRAWGSGLHHLIDPRTGRPSTGDVAEVTVVAGSALAAEVLAKTALLLGSSAGAEMLRTSADAWQLVPA